MTLLAPSQLDTARHTVALITSACAEDDLATAQLISELPDHDMTIVVGVLLSAARLALTCGEDLAPGFMDTALMRMGQKFAGEGPDL